MEQHNRVSLVIFTCEGREFLLSKTIASFRQACRFNFEKIILAIDGDIAPEIIKMVDPDIVIQSTRRKGYVINIIQALAIINTPYFFWLEDDWLFNKPFSLEVYLQHLLNNPDWVEIILSKFGPLDDELKQYPIEGDFYRSDGFSANPCLCKTEYVKQGFDVLANSPKGDTLGADGFENSLTVTFNKGNLICVIADPVDHYPISHEGYLESTPRNWHMTNSLDKKTEKHLLIIPTPSLARKLYMIIKLIVTFCKIAFKQLFSNKIYEYCFRVIAGAKQLR